MQAEWLCNLKYEHIYFFMNMRVHDRFICTICNILDNQTFSHSYSKTIRWLYNLNNTKYIQT